MTKLKPKIDNRVTSEYIDDIICALKLVEKEFIVNVNADADDESKYKYPERIYAYEFYHQYRKIMEEKKEKYDGLFLNGEQPKSSSVWNGLSSITPDIVLHRKVNEKDETAEGQKWLCEIKMAGNPGWIDDLKKIKDKEEVLKFHDYIFLMIGKTREIFKQHLKSSHLKKEDVNLETICILANNDDETITIECSRLEELM